MIASGGSLITTWPSSMFDRVLNVLHLLHLISNELEGDEHQKRIPMEMLQQMLQLIGFQKFIYRRFELGVNNLVVASR